MNLIPIRPDSIQLGTPLPSALRTHDGALLARRGLVVATRSQLDFLVNRAGTLYIDVDEAPEQKRAYRSQLDTLVREEKTIGEIASAQMVMKSQPTPGNLRIGPPDWQELQLRATQLLKQPQTPDFLAKIGRLHAELATHHKRQPDATLFALTYLASREMSMYSATHAMLVDLVCTMAARDVLQWDEAMVETTGMAALTMNLSMTALQDELAQQVDRPTEAQMALISMHATAATDMLRQLGVADPHWLQAVRLHHEPPSGPLADMSPGERVARLIERADIFAARLSPRASRAAMPAAAAMRATYFDDQQRVDEAGAALVTALGIYPPGSFVRLASNEVAVVLKRGRTGTTPRVAAVMNRQGMPIGEIVVRDTSLAHFKISASLPHREVKLQLSIDRMVGMI